MVRRLPIIGIVEDDLIYQFMLSRVIKRNNLAKRVITFSDGEKAIQYLTDNKATNENIPDVIFLDINMPIMDGWQFIEEYAILKTEIKKKIAIFMLSFSVNPIDIERAREISEISEHIIKPITLEEVKRIINNYETFL